MDVPQSLRDKMSNPELCWDEFLDWCEDNGVDIECKEDWETWWDCWSTAIVVKLESLRHMSLKDMLETLEVCDE